MTIKSIKRIALYLSITAVCLSHLNAQERLAKLRPNVSFCGNRMLNGHYAISIVGSRPAPQVVAPFPTSMIGMVEQVTGVFILIFDGFGAIKMADNPTVKGSLSGLFPDKPGIGTYSVNSDCSGTFSVSLPQLPAPLVNNMVVTNGGQAFRAVVISPQTVMISLAAEQI